MVSRGEGISMVLGGCSGPRRGPARARGARARAATSLSALAVFALVSSALSPLDAGAQIR